jgi:hypothetical protein
MPRRSAVTRRQMLADQPRQGRDEQRRVVERRRAAVPADAGPLRHVGEEDDRPRRASRCDPRRTTAESPARPCTPSRPRSSSTSSGAGADPLDRPVRDWYASIWRFGSFTRSRMPRRVSSTCAA